MNVQGILSKLGLTALILTAMGSAQAQTGVEADFPGMSGCFDFHNIYKYDGEGVAEVVEQDGQKIVKLCVSGNGSRSSLTLKFAKSDFDINGKNKLDLPFETSMQFYIDQKPAKTCKYAGKIISVNKNDSRHPDLSAAGVLITMDYPNFDKVVNRSIREWWNNDMTCPPLRSERITIDAKILDADDLRK